MNTAYTNMGFFGRWNALSLYVSALTIFTKPTRSTARTKEEYTIRWRGTGGLSIDYYDYYHTSCSHSGRTEAAFLLLGYDIVFRLISPKEAHNLAT